MAGPPTSDESWNAAAAEVAEVIRRGERVDPTPEQIRLLSEALVRRDEQLRRRIAERVGPGPQPRRLFFTHVMKTGGTSLLTALAAHFGTDATYPARSDGDPQIARPYSTPWRLTQAFANRGDDLRFVAGHFPHRAHELVGVPFTTVTVLRDPVSRTVSYLRQLRRESSRDPAPSLAECYEDPTIRESLLGNHMVKVFSLTRQEAATGIEAPVPMDAGRLDDALATLDTVDHVGVADRLHELWRELEVTYDWDLGPVRRLNAATGHDEVPAGLVRRIEADVELDRVLYEAAVARCDRNRS